MVRKRIAKPEYRGSLRARLVLFVALPAGLLGVSYFLFVEYVLESQGVAGHGLRIALRIGGLTLLATSLVLAVACGFLLSERVTRPVRLLLRMIESGDVAATRGLFLHHRDWEVYSLYRKVLALVQQNQAGAKTLEELESLHTAIDGLQRDLKRTAPHGVPPPLEVATAGPLGPVVEELESNRQRVVAFIAELQGRTGRLRTELDELRLRLEQSKVGREPRMGPADLTVGGTNGSDGPREVLSNSERTDQVRNTLEELRRVGTVLSLTAERARDRDDSPGTLYDRFAHDVDAIEGLLLSMAREAESLEVARRDGDAELNSHLRRLEECLGGLERRLEETGQ